MNVLWKNPLGRNVSAFSAAKSASVSSSAGSADGVVVGDAIGDVIAHELEAVVQRVQCSLVIIADDSGNPNDSHGFGAGIVWQPGLVVTNHHVVSHLLKQRHRTAQNIVRVTLPGDKNLPGEVVATKPEWDLAIIKINDRSVPAAMIAASQALRVGELVLAIGHPWGQPGVVTAGIVTGLGKAQTNGRDTPGRETHGRERGSNGRDASHRGEVDVIHSDVTLAPGNSGGPLVNAAGAVVGMNTMIVGGDLGVAIPSHVIQAFVDETPGGLKLRSNETSGVL